MATPTKSGGGTHETARAGSLRREQRKKKLEEVDPGAEPTRRGSRYGNLEHLEEAKKELDGEQRIPYQDRQERKQGGKRLLSHAKELAQQTIQGNRDLRLQNRASQDEQLRQVAKASRGGMATLDKRTGKIKEGIGGADSKEIAQQMKQLRSGRSSASQEAALQAKDLRTGAGSRRNFQSATRGARKERQKKDRAALVTQNKNRLKKMKSGAGASQEMTAQMKKFAGVMWIRANWAWIFPSFGHTIYFINLSYFIGFMRKFIGFYLPIEIPAVGEAWLYQPGSKTMSGGKTKALVLKLFEFLAIAFITLLVVAVDMLFLASIGIIIVMAAKASNIPILGGIISSAF